MACNMGTRKRLRRTDLFLVRVWREYDKPTSEFAGTASGALPDDHGGGQLWHGQVRRVSSGESLQFDSLAALLDVLTSMLGGIDDKGEEQA